MIQAAEIDHFLACPTPDSWVAAAVGNQDILLIDHANCEKKAAATAFNLMFQYGDRDPALQDAMSRLAREELRHFEQVMRLMRRRGIANRPLAAARYAAGLRSHIRKREPERLLDLLIIGAFIEARSCERFRALSVVLDAELGEFYAGLAAAESRHFVLYLTLAEKRSDDAAKSRVDEFAEIEAQLVNRPDQSFRFHSGVPENAM
ncbi:MAG: tRNA-(ms[2]io[6]A)-hydroxylase [Gammaproteobacteria bacterium]